MCKNDELSNIYSCNVRLRFGQVLRLILSHYSVTKNAPWFTCDILFIVYLRYLFYFIVVKFNFYFEEFIENFSDYCFRHFDLFLIKDQSDGARFGSRGGKFLFVAYRTCSPSLWPLNYA